MVIIIIIIIVTGREAVLGNIIRTLHRVSHRQNKVSSCSGIKERLFDYKNKTKQKNKQTTDITNKNFHGSDVK